MGLFDSFKKMIRSDNSSSSAKQVVNCEELIQLISFTQKVKPLMGGNYGITVAYSQPDRRSNEYTAPVHAEFGFYDFNYIKFARNYALDAGRSDLAHQMVPFYYNSINKDAGITRDDWPYRMDVFDFARILTNRDPHPYISLIPDNNDEDIYKLRVVTGFTTQNGVLAYNLIEKECLSRFPNLKIQKQFVYPERFLFKISL